MSFLFRSCLIACIAVTALSACGNKGDLVMPTKKPATPATTPEKPTTDSTPKPATSP
jgi:predicted small lipoprotein YifL